MDERPDVRRRRASRGCQAMGVGRAEVPKRGALAVPAERLPGNALGPGRISPAVSRASLARLPTGRPGL
jgi:hypothetical protein